MMRRDLVRSVLALVLLSACGDNTPTGASTVTGTYTLRTVNGAALPYTMSQTATSKVELLDDAISLYQGGTYSTVSHVRTTTNGTPVTETREGAGTYILLGTSITLVTSDRSSQRLATGDATSMTFVESGVTQIYRK